MSKIKIRKDIYETNSSSMHTVVLTKKVNEYVTPEEIRNELKEKQSEFVDFVDKKKTNIDTDEFYIKCETDSFGREFRLLTTWYEKLIYVIANIRELGDADTIGSVIKDYLQPNCKGIEVLKYDYYLTQTLDGSCPSVDRDAEYDLFGSIDHQSYDNLNNAIEALKDGTKEERIKKIIFSNEVVIVVDGDESYAFEELLTGGFFAKDTFTKILHETYDNKTWEHVSSEFIDISEKFKNEDEESDYDDNETLSL